MKEKKAHRARLRYEDRKEIEKLLKKGFSVNEISEAIGVHRVTIYNELRRCPQEYRADEAQKTL